MVQAAAIEEMLEQDLPQALRLLADMNQSIESVSKLVDNMLHQVKKGEMSTDSGLSFLEMKYHMLLSYLINITYVVLRKVSGQKIEGDPAIDRLVEIRTVLERIRPIDHKLKYQIDKLVKAAVTGTTDANDPSRFRANPDNFASKLGESDEGNSSDSDSADEKGNKDKKKPGVYVPPKLAAVHYDEDDTPMSRQQKQLERARKRALQSSVMQELREEYMDTPTEISQASASQTVLSRRDKEREEYEETYFTRLPVTKEQKHKSRRLTTLGTLGDDLTRFADISVLEGGAGFSAPSKKRKAGGKGMKKGKGKKKKFH